MKLVLNADTRYGAEYNVYNLFIVYSFAVRCKEFVDKRNKIKDFRYMWRIGKAKEVKFLNLARTRRY